MLTSNIAVYFQTGDYHDRSRQSAKADSRRNRRGEEAVSFQRRARPGRAHALLVSKLARRHGAVRGFLHAGLPLVALYQLFSTLHVCFTTRALQTSNQPSVLADETTGRERE